MHRQFYVLSEVFVQCRSCDRAVDFSPFRKESLHRFRQFAVFAAILLLAALVLYALDVSVWPWWLVGAGLFVLSQALLKWHDSRWVFCHDCQKGFTWYGRI